MNSESTFTTAVRFFLLVVIGALLSAAMGGGFGAVVALISPQWFSAQEGGIRSAVSLGMIIGLFIGAGVACFACLLATVIKILRIRLEHTKARETGDGR